MNPPGGIHHVHNAADVTLNNGPYLVRFFTHHRDTHFLVCSSINPPISSGRLRSLGSFRAVSEQLTFPNEILRAEASCVKPICKDFSEDNFHKGI